MDSRSRFRHRSRLAGQLVLLLLACTCGILDVPNIPSNPMDPSDPSFETPKVSFSIAPNEGATVDTCYVLLAWSGNHPGMSFSYQMDSESWSDWVGDTSVVYTYLDEGSHTFLIRSRYYNGVESQAPISLSFTVDDIHGPALRFYPRYKIVSSGSSFSLEVFLEEVVNVAGVKAVITFDPVYLLVDQIDIYEDVKSLLKQNSGTVIPFYSYDNADGSATIEAGAATGDPPGVSGTGPIAKITFIANRSASIEIVFTPVTELRTPENTHIPILELVGAFAAIQ